MSESDLRKVVAAIDAALAVFSFTRDDKLAVAEIRARLSLAGAKRQLQEHMREMMSGGPERRNA